MAANMIGRSKKAVNKSQNRSSDPGRACEGLGFLISGVTKVEIDASEGGGPFW
jgi:hypothetical protein